MICVCSFLCKFAYQCKTQTTILWHKCLLLYVLYPRFFSTYGDLESISFFVFITFYTFCCKKVKPGSMQNIINVYFVHEYNVIFIILQKASSPSTFTSFQQDKNKHFRDHVSGIDKNVIEHAVGDILIFLYETF